MPHCVIEHSGNFDTKSTMLIEAVYQGALKTDLFTQKDIKVRTLSFTHFITGGTNKPFIHVMSKMLDGRTNEQKVKLSKAIQESIQSLKLGDCALTIEIVDIDKATYFKS